MGLHGPVTRGAGRFGARISWKDTALTAVLNRMKTSIFGTPKAQIRKEKGPPRWASLLKRLERRI
jgi:hypothetical protein